jgi:proteasome lid subunit RPN8/RPN11
LPPEVIIAFAAVMWEEIIAALDHVDETAGVLLAGVAEDNERLIFTVNRVIWVPEEQYVERTPRRLSISSAGWVPALKAAADMGLHPVFFHTHPGGEPRPSELDDDIDAALAGSFRTRARVKRYVSFILGGTVAQPSFSGRVFDEAGSFAAVTRARVVGSRLRMLPGFEEAEASVAARQVHDRQVRAFGAAGQFALAQLHVAVVGAGGTGSAVLEQLTRLGVRNIVSIDDDVITSTNVSRVYGSTSADDGRAKVRVAKDHAERIGLGTRLVCHEGLIDKREGLGLLRTCDVVFGCTDDHTGRLNLSLLAFYYLVPIIDLGVAIDAPNERIRSITGRVTYVGPGEPCLLCRGVVDPARVRDEGYEPDERARLAGEGYAQGIGEPDPSVVAYTTMVAAWGVADLLERLFGFGADDIAGELHLRIADRKMKGRHALPTPGHICADRGRWGLGDQPAFLGQSAWPT